ncbi:sensor domain-containing protein [Streptomyces bambusae]|uniref:sensor histidine kinase n=1 Tax=Streptomyces bambusae TaxID=1550616 RepID=UPI001CFDD564|nr:sensor histidine kinase [Streptomyces bambusae]MCB5164141.1 sensor domain-containing protein [Streptomyces bambusae]
MAEAESVAVWEAVRRRPVRFLWSAWPLRVWAYLLSGAVSGFAALAVLSVLIVTGFALSLLGIGLLLLTAAVVSAVPLAAAERRRLRLVEPAVPAGPHVRPPRPGAPAWLATRLRERATWREFGYVLLFATVFTAAGYAFTALLGLSVMLTVSPVIVWAIAPDTVMLVPGQPVSGPVGALPGTAAGLAGLVVSAYAGSLLAGVQVRVARALLAAREEPSDDSRVIELTRSRARLADAFEAERRRIERDLHDGAQQHLVALMMTLGLAELQLRGQESPASALIVRARAEARQALEELRGLIRGIHPQVLTDHGLAAAVDELALRSAVPVTADIRLPSRPAPSVETVAYFTVTEALANAAKHSGAGRVEVVGRLTGGVLVLTVTDDGRGGADPAAGTGLQGLADRLAIVKGRLTVTSPVGGPTVLRVEVPCSG